jgi:hypothetical protein
LAGIGAPVSHGLTAAFSERELAPLPELEDRSAVNAFVIEAMR